MSAMAQDYGRLAARMRMARRVADALLPQEDDVIIEAAASGEILAGATDQIPATADFFLTSLDLRLGIMLLPEQSATALQDRAVLEAANRFLWANPNTLACVLVADDAPLSSRIVDPGEGLDPDRRSSAGRPSSVRGPLRQTVMAYLRTIKPTWQPPETLADQQPLDYPQAARAASASALAEREAASSPIPERKEVRRSLGEDDALWAAQLALKTVRGEDVNVDSALRAAGQGGESR